jgi:hypothetical protein
MSRFEIIIFASSPIKVMRADEISIPCDKVKKEDVMEAPYRPQFQLKLRYQRAYAQPLL